MNAHVFLQTDEMLLSQLTGLFELFDGTQTISFGHLCLTNKRLYLCSAKPINLQQSLWFKGEHKEIIADTLIVGTKRMTVKWRYRGNWEHFTEIFYQLSFMETGAKR